MRARWIAVAAALLIAATGADSATAALGRFSVGYTSERALRAALAHAHGTVVRTVPALRIAEVRSRGSGLAFAAAIACRPGIRSVEPVAARSSRAEPALTARLSNGLPLEWAYGATDADAVPPEIQDAAGALTIAVVDTGADVTVPDLAAKAPTGVNVHLANADVRDTLGHGTFVASLAAGAPANGEGIAGFGGAARLLVVKAGTGNGAVSDVDEAMAIVYAVDHGARIVNLSLGGPHSTVTERSAVAYAAAQGVLLVAAAGNDAQNGNPVEYPAALLAQESPDGTGPAGLAVGASTMLGGRAPFSSFGSYVSLLAPGVDVLGALPAHGPVASFRVVRVPGSHRGRYGLASGTSFSAPQVAGAAALVWAASPGLTASEVATVIEQTASGGGAWTPELGYGVLNVAAAVARASGQPLVDVDGIRTRGGIRLTWQGHGVSTFRIAMSEDGRASRVLTAATTDTAASYPLAGGHTYAFTVSGLGAGGAPAAVSSPFSVATMRSGAAVSLDSRRSGTPTSSLLMLTASLSATLPGVPLTERPLVLEARRGRHWRVVGRARTDMAGQAEWTLRLARRRYAVRVVFPGADDLDAATASRSG